MNSRNAFWGLFLYFLVAFHALIAQNKMDFTIQIGSKNINQDETFVISITVPAMGTNSESIVYKFPELANFQKLGISRGKSSNYQNGQIEQRIIYSQHYQPVGVGQFYIPAEEVMVNQQSQKFEPFYVFVNPTNGGSIENNSDEISLADEVLAKANQPFLLVASNQVRPFVGQGFTLKFSLFVPENNTQELEFDRNDIQIPKLIQQLRPRNCWEESFGLQVEKVSKVEINQKKYTEYRFFQATYFALNHRPIQIPALSLQILKKEKVAGELKSIPIVFKSPALLIQPRALPNHPLASKVPVGIYTLKESISKNLAKTGEQLVYTSSIIGDGNGILWDSKGLESDYFIDFNRLSTQSSVFPSMDKMVGDKTEIIQIIPKQPGKFALKQYFYWIYFNTRTEKFDTLRSKIDVEIQGQPSDSRVNTSREMDGLYRGIENMNSDTVVWNRWVNWRQLANLTIFSIFVVLVFLVWKTKK
ncbi:protein BatD [Aquirufa ecclesiirivi]|uniref:Protein BatD n=1 Tax=Aquirufa ecclesiirivi TaxID=2715124 RepID=A0ABT4JK47_9BACT|nr:BatD family protein [Aquirufa ecclesiirivi]MCZ2476204.1 protein BatD [Aquirufa ecclesiirivi]